MNNLLLQTKINYITRTGKSEPIIIIIIQLDIYVLWIIEPAA